MLHLETIDDLQNCRVPKHASGFPSRRLDKSALIGMARLSRIQLDVHFAALSMTDRILSGIFFVIELD
jgi:hypothetical protein